MAFVAAMENALGVYHLPYDPDFLMACMDESCRQLISEVRTSIPFKPGNPACMDEEYVRNGVAQVYMDVEPLAGRSHVAITEQKTRKDWAHQIKEMLDVRYPKAIKIRLHSKAWQLVRVQNIRGYA